MRWACLYDWFAFICFSDQIFKWMNVWKLPCMFCKFCTRNESPYYLKPSPLCVFFCWGDSPQQRDDSPYCPNSEANCLVVLKFRLIVSQVTTHPKIFFVPKFIFIITILTRIMSRVHLYFQFSFMRSIWCFLRDQILVLCVLHICRIEMLINIH